MRNRALNNYEPINSSVFLLVVKFFAILFVSDILYLLVSVFWAEIFQPNIYNDLTMLTIGFILLKSVVQIILVMLLVFHWLYHKYHIDYEQRKLYEHTGLIHTKEHMSDLKNVRDVMMEQSVFGKIFNYGTIVLSISASGGYAEKVTMKNIQDPELYIDYLESTGAA